MSKKEILRSNLGASNVRQEYRSSVYADAHGSTCYDAWSAEDALIDAIEATEETEPLPERKELKPFYKLSDLSRLCGLSPRHIRSMFESAGVEIDPGSKGSSPVITLAQVCRAFPSFYESAMRAREANDREELARLAKLEEQRRK